VVSAEGGAVYSQGSLDLNGVTVQNNIAQGNGGAAGKAGQDAAGGGIYSSGSLTLEGGTLIQNNQALGGNGGHNPAGPGGNGLGGGLYVSSGSASLTATGIPFRSPGDNRLLGDYQDLIAVGNVQIPGQRIDTTDKIDPFFYSVTLPGGHSAGSLAIGASTASSGALVAGMSLLQVGAPTLVPPILSAATSQGVGTIVGDEPSISISDVMTREGGNGTTLFTFTVTLSAAYDRAVTMSYRTVDGTATTIDGDYVAKTGTLTFALSETTKKITIDVKGDSKKEADEYFYLELFVNSSNSLFTNSRGIGHILNDD
jgi:hypothetical protein